MLTLLLAALFVQSAQAGDPDAVAPAILPVLLGSPTCDHAKLGSVTVRVGEQVSGITQDARVATVQYRSAFAKLRDAAQQDGANAVVLRGHQAVFFTFHGKRSRDPVYIKLRGAAIALADMGQCQFEVADADQLQRQARAGEATNVSSHEAFGR